MKQSSISSGRLPALVVGSLCLLLASAAAGTQTESERVGQFGPVSGGVTVVHGDGSEQPARKGMELAPGDRVVCDESGRAEFSLEALGDFRLHASAEVAVDELAAADPEDRAPVLRLVLGYLWAKIKRLTRSADRTLVQTPTAVVGLRGTELDTVVSLDGTSMVTVDEGKISLADAEREVELSPGRAARVDAEGRLGAVETAVARDRRDWQAWRRERARRLEAKLPDVVARIDARMEKKIPQFEGFADRLETAIAALNADIRKLRQARRTGRRMQVRRYSKAVRTRAANFRERSTRLRAGFNRLRAVRGQVHRLEAFYRRHQQRYSPSEAAALQAAFESIHGRQERIRERALRLIGEIRSTFQTLRELSAHRPVNSGSSRTRG